MLRLRYLRNKSVNGIKAENINHSINITNVTVNLQYGNVYSVQEVSLPDSSGNCDILFNDGILLEIHKSEFEVWTENTLSNGEPPPCGCNK